MTNAELGPVGIPFVRGGDIGDGWINTATTDHIRLEFADRVRAKVAWAGDVAFITKGTVGRAGRLRQGQPAVVFAPQVAYWRVLAPEILDSGFLFYLIQSHAFQSALDGVKTHGSMVADYVSISLQHDFAFRFPDINSQRAIAHILGTLDDKIELNRRMNETLEAMAQAIFKSWFVDFLPVRAKAAARTQTGDPVRLPAEGSAQVGAKAEGRDPGLPKPLADLFPGSFMGSDLGEIPKGWQCSVVGKHFKLTMGQSPPGSTYNESGDGLPFFQGRTDFGFRFPSRRVFCTGPARLAEVGDTPVSVRAPVGNVNVAIEPCAVGRGVAAVRHLSGSRSFTYHAMHNLGEHFDKFEGEGTVFGAINKADFERLPFVAPHQAVLDYFERIASPIDDRVESNEVESRTLTDLRNTLLPKLISGELRVKGSERGIENVQ